jgi:hypothetical protein
VYEAPWARFGPYGLGVLTAFVLDSHLSRLHRRISIKWRVALMALCGLLFAGVVYGPAQVNSNLTAYSAPHTLCSGLLASGVPHRRGGGGVICDV